MKKNFIIDKRNELFLLTLIVTGVLFVASNYSLAFDSVSQENEIGINFQNEFSYNSLNQNVNYLSTQKFNNLDLETFEYDLLDYDDYVRPHKILDRSNIHLHINHLQETFISRKTSPLNNLFPQYPPNKKIIRLKIFLI